MASFHNLPLFVTSTSGVPNMSDLKERIRLSGIVINSDADFVMHSVIAGVRGKLYGRLGITQVAAVLVTNPVAAPTSSATIIRMIAYECEILMVIVDLMCRLPMLFMDNSSGIDEVYNNEGAFRSMDADTLAQCKAEFNAQIADWLDILSGAVDLGNVGGPLQGRTFTQVDQDPKVYPGGTLRGDNVVLFTNPAAARALGLST